MLPGRESKNMAWLVYIPSLIRFNLRLGFRTVHPYVSFGHSYAFVLQPTLAEKDSSTFFVRTPESHRQSGGYHIVKLDGMLEGLAIAGGPWSIQMLLVVERHASSHPRMVGNAK
jgi:hypothetical protein